MSAFDDEDQLNSGDEGTEIPEGFEEVGSTDTEEVDLENSDLADFTFEEEDNLSFTDEDKPDTEEL